MTKLMPVNVLLKTGLLTCLSLFQLAAFGSQDWAVHGFASQGIIQAADNNFVSRDADDDISYDLTEIGINASYQWQPDIRFAGQLVYLNGGNRYEEGARVDYLLMDWTLASDIDWQLNLYLGRYKNQHWLYSSTRDVPHTRPSTILPQSVYYDIFRDVALGSDGMSLSYTRLTDIGEFDLLWSYGTSPISDNATTLLLSTTAAGDIDQDFTHQASLFYRPEGSTWQYGISLLDSDFKYSADENEGYFDADATSQRVMLNLLYNSEQWEFTAELFQERFFFDGFFTPDWSHDQKAQGFYAQGRYFFDEQLTFMLRYDRFDANKDDRKGKALERNTGIPAYFGYMYDTTLGLTYRFESNWQIQAEYHWFEGTGRLAPAVVPDLATNNSKNWQLWALQLMYWF
ncbi:TonB-dependent receptor [Thalassomonas haliotis]|uniref:TonB-dependent receptor n=1 Tax=Thalassomonas haliotis TaxID=485448 RepID=A0ABY7VJH3_9GAMM|nr:TonB-dependent receptor [Thalassomonas haliotis]WDE12822.1 TonB-dependent receptor [Thalassomonas haliotis]